MSIRVLPEQLIHQIAAGEVVERPASVVKELVENSLDAGASLIEIEIEGGGASLVRVRDDGAGIAADELALALARHATSKIGRIEDLESVRTLGFRGEALPSIAAVSRFSLVTREASADSGTAVVIEGGKLVSAAETGAAPGTMVTVAQLFFNTPARRKFLKAIATEMAHVSDIVAGMALAWKKMAALSSIESWQYHNWIDNRREGGLRIGLRRFPDDAEEPLGRKPVWHVFRALDSAGEEAAIAFALPLIGLSSWAEAAYTGPIGRGK
jgi:DNA mismatch repair protein MutL